jgi:hypothetical protein
MNERGPWTGHLTKLVQQPPVTIEFFDRERVNVSGVFSIPLDVPWRERPAPETLEAEIAEAIRGVLQKYVRE